MHPQPHRDTYAREHAWLELRAAFARLQSMDVQTPAAQKQFFAALADQLDKDGLLKPAQIEALKAAKPAPRPTAKCKNGGCSCKPA